MIQEESYLKVADNTGAKMLKTVSMATSVMWSSPPCVRPHLVAR